MGEIIAWRCDICRSIVEEPKFKFHSYEFEFQVSPIDRWTASNNDVVCSEDCIKAALNVWIADRNREAKNSGKEPEINVVHTEGQAS